MAKIRMAQYGTGHGHASGKWLAMKKSAEVELVGIFEPDPERRKAAEGRAPYDGARWFDSVDQMLGDQSIVAVASEGRNIESLDQTEAIVEAGRHVWYDKPAGDNWVQWQRVVRKAEEQKLLVQLGYMFRYHQGFSQVTAWARSGFLGEVFSVRAHMSTSLTEAARRIISDHRGGILYDLGGHMLDQVVWMLGRPRQVTAFVRNDTGVVPGFGDNTLGVFEFEKAIAFIDIAAMETPPMARRFEVYGSQGSAILVEPFEPGRTLRVCLDEARDGFLKGEQTVHIPPQDRQVLYERELVAFLAALRGKQPPDRDHAHELLVQETLLRATGGIAG
ncbi:MAG: Gfo/Idh/MocA family oxidoreductase [Candidatus Handelsmanbacteria bacterium]|nr:Gfo/Idh/MocA family oxidoreductase [Candidatus Handelsmanbacteria bacterium]